MMENDILIYFDIIASIKTTQDLHEISSEIDNLLTSIFETKNQSFDNALKSISITASTKIKETLAKNGLDITNKELIQNFLIGLKELLRKFKTIRLVIAFEPSDLTIENIHNWVASNLGQGYILHIETDRAILGGAIVVSSNGQYRDFTVKKSLEETFSAKREQILQLSSLEPGSRAMA